MSKPDPAKAVYVPMGKRKLPKPKAVDNTENEWVPHTQPVAIDDWGAAIRTMRKAGIHV